MESIPIMQSCEMCFTVRCNDKGETKLVALLHKFYNSITTDRKDFKQNPFGGGGGCGG